MAPRGRRPHISLEAQLQQLTLFSDLDSDLENLEQLGPIIKGLDEARQQDAFLRYLENFVHEKDREIEKICKENHMEFVSALDKLLKVRSGTITLKHRIGELNEDIQAGGHSLSARKKQLLETRRIVNNVDDATEVLEASLKVLNMAHGIDGLIESKEYYSALRSLDDLENIHLRGVMQFEFAKHMLESIPSMRESIRQAVMKEMKEWLYEARENQRIVGKLALEAMEARVKRWKAKSQRDPMLALAKINSAIEMVVNEKVEYNFVENEHVTIDFKPLYQAIHIFDVMDLREKLQNSYQEDRRAQANLLLSQGLSFDPSKPTFPALLEEVVGFFLVEYHVLQTAPPGWRAEQEVDDLWDNMCERVVDIVGTGLKDSKDTNVYVSTKSAIMTFIQTLESYNFGVSKLNALLLTLFERYAQLLRYRFSEDFQQAVKETDHQPMVVNNTDELRKVLNVCWLKPGDADELRKQPFPLTLPFSQTYPLCCMDIRHLVDEYYTFSEGFSQHHRDIDDILKQALDELLIQQVSTSIRSSLEKTSNLSQIAQIVVNAEHFKLACTELETLLIALRAPARGGKLRLDASPHFNTSLELAQKRIDTATAAKLGQFLDLEEYNMTPSRPRKECAEHIPEMLAWLSTMMESVLSLLPAETKRVAYRNAFKYIADHLMKTCLISDREPKINEAGLRNVELDVEYLQQHASQFGNKEEDMTSVFAELRQTISLVLKESATDYAHSATIRSQRYPDVQPARLLSVLDKLAKWHASIPNHAEQEAAARIYRDKDAVVRMMRRG